jgi:hypothetical protein
MRWRKRMCVGAATILCAAVTQAAELGSDMFSFDAFGTLGVVHSSEDEADYTSTAFKPNGAGHTHVWSADVDSDVGAQLTATFSPQWSAVAQVVSQQSYDNSYRPDIAWADVKYQITPDFNARLGRILLPNFLDSDFRNVGYAKPWVRSPVELYGTEPLTYDDGIDLSYRLHLGAVTSTVVGNYGLNYSINFPGGESANARTPWGIFDRTEYGSWLLNLSYVGARLSFEPPILLFDALRQFGPQGVALANKYDFVNKRGDIVSFGASYDPGKWFAMAEWSQVNTRSFVGLSTAWYVSAGYRLAKFTPYLTYAAVKQARTSDPGLSVAALPAFLAGPATALNTGLNDILASRPVQRTLSAGVRWDFAKNLDLKLQCDHTRLGPGSPGILINTQPDFRPGGTVNVFSAAVDFVF